MNTHFTFEALPEELQARVISFAGLVTDSPARDLPPQVLSGFRYMELCCGRCENCPEGRKLPGCCDCHPANRFSRSLCECSPFSHPVLAAGRNLRRLGLEHVYREAEFEVGPFDVEEFQRIIDLVINIDKDRLARVKNLRILLWFSSENYEAIMSMEDDWTEMFESLHDHCARPDASIELLLVPYPCHYDGLEDIVRMMRRLSNAVGLDNVEVATRPSEWLIRRIWPDVHAEFEDDDGA